MEAETDALTRAWTRTQERLPVGWTLDSLRCASAGLHPDERSDDWIAVAVGPKGRERAHRAGDALSVLAGLAEGLGATDATSGA